MPSPGARGAVGPPHQRPGGQHAIAGRWEGSGCTGTCRSGLSPGGPGAADRPRGSCWPGGEPPRTTWSGVPHGGWRGARLGPRRGRGHRVVLRASSSLTAGLSNRSHHDDRYPCRRPRRPARGVPGRGVRGPEPGAEGLRSRVDDVAAARGARARGAGQTPRTRPRAAARGTRDRGLESRSGAAPGAKVLASARWLTPAGSNLAQCCAGPGVHVHRVRQARASWGHEPHRVLSVQRRCCPPDLPGRSTHTLRVPEAMGPKAIRPARPRARRRPRGPHGPRRRKESP